MKKIDMHCHILPGIDDICKSERDISDATHGIKSGLACIVTPHTSP